MAIYHCSVSNVSRANGSSSCATLAYISGERVHDERTGQTYSYGRKERILEVGTIIPDNAPAEYANPATLFNAIEGHEKAQNARIAKKIEVALPKELELTEQKEIIENYIKHNLTKKGYCATYAIHDGGEKENIHAHILVTNRPINNKGTWGGKCKKEYARDKDGNKIPVIDEATGKQKVRIRSGKGKELLWVRVNVEKNPLDTKDFLFHLRKAWAEEVNKHLEPSQQIDHRSNEERGIKDKATIHEGYAARAIEERGGISERCEINREIKRENAERHAISKQLETANAEISELEHKKRELQERLRKYDRRREAYNIRQVGNEPFTSQQTVSTEQTHVVKPLSNGNSNNTEGQTRRAERIKALEARREHEAHIKPGYHEEEWELHISLDSVKAKYPQAVKPNNEIDWGLTRKHAIERSLGRGRTLPIKAVQELANKQMYLVKEGVIQPLRIGTKAMKAVGSVLGLLPVVGKPLKIVLEMPDKMVLGGKNTGGLAEDALFAKFDKLIQTAKLAKTGYQQGKESKQKQNKSRKNGNGGFIGAIVKDLMDIDKRSNVGDTQGAVNAALQLRQRMDQLDADEWAWLSEAEKQDRRNDTRMLDRY